MKSFVNYIVFILFLYQASCTPQERGCTDPSANNLDSLATENDGSCTYDPVWIEPSKTLEMSDSLMETSGLILWDGLIWTHNDNSDTRLYGLDSSTAEIRQVYSLDGVVNRDWEDIAEDGAYIYIGDFGNNGSGNRTDLHILRVDMSTLESGNASIDTIWFSYSDQIDFNPTAPNQTEFDCEALVASRDSLYLFTKRWLTGQTSLYALPKQPGTYVAVKKASYDIQGLVSGATLLESERLLVLCGYTAVLQPFIYLFYDYPAHDYFSGNRRRLEILIPFLQVEGITTPDGLNYYVSNEFSNFQPAVMRLQQLHLFDLSEYLEGYLSHDVYSGP